MNEFQSVDQVSISFRESLFIDTMNTPIPKNIALQLAPNRALLLVASEEPSMVSKAHCTATIETQESMKLINFRVISNGFFILFVTITP